MFLFEAQTGRVSRSFVSSRSLDTWDWQSNYYHYLLDDKWRRWVTEHVEKAELGSGGLEYDREFLQRLPWRDLQPAVKRGRLVHDW